MTEVSQCQLPSAVCSHHPLHSDLGVENKSGRHHSGEGGEPGDRVCEIVDAPASFEPDMEKHSGFPESRNENGDKASDGKELPDFLQAFICLFFNVCFQGQSAAWLRRF